MFDAKKLLELCQLGFPSHRTHHLTFREGKLVLTLMLGNTYQSFNLEEGDLTKAPEMLLADVTRLFRDAEEIV